MTTFKKNIYLIDSQRWSDSWVCMLYKQTSVGYRSTTIVTLHGIKSLLFNKNMECLYKPIQIFGLITAAKSCTSHYSTTIMSFNLISFLFNGYEVGSVKILVYTTESVRVCPSIHIIQNRHL